MSHIPHGDRLRMRPSYVTGELGTWLFELWRVVIAAPTLSHVSVVHPNVSRITGHAGDLLVNLGSGSTVSRLWIMGGDPSTSTTTGWRLIDTRAVS